MSFPQACAKQWELGFLLPTRHLLNFPHDAECHMCHCCALCDSWMNPCLDPRPPDLMPAWAMASHHAPSTYAAPACLDFSPFPTAGSAPRHRVQGSSPTTWEVLVSWSGKKPSIPHISWRFYLGSALSFTFYLFLIELNFFILAPGDNQKLPFCLPMWSLASVLWILRMVLIFCPYFQLWCQVCLLASLLFFLVWFCGRFCLIHLSLYWSSQQMDGYMNRQTDKHTNILLISFLMIHGCQNSNIFGLCETEWCICVCYHYPLHNPLNIIDIQHMPIISNKAKTTVVMWNSSLVSKWRRGCVQV